MQPHPRMVPRSILGLGISSWGQTLYCVRCGATRDDWRHELGDCQDTLCQFVCCLVLHFYISQDNDIAPYVWASK